MPIVDDAFTDMYGIEQLENYKLELSYNNRFKPYNANVRLRGDEITFNLSSRWETVSREIQIGLVQELMLKIFRNRLRPKTTKTKNIELYNFFMQKIHIAAPKDNIDAELQQSFERVNNGHFNGMLEQTNLKWNSSTRKLGSYEFGSDTITISKALEKDQEALDYVMYHEMLHKKYKFKRRQQKSIHHAGTFKKKEAEFPNSSQIEARLGRLAASRRRKLFFKHLFN